jgi:hypothetical protein
MARTTDAELACDSALERAKAQIMAPFQLRNATNNGWEILGPDFFVSVCAPIYDDTNRINPTKMRFDPSPPVFVDTNRGDATGPSEDRFYHDVNRNGYFEETGYAQVTGNNSQGIPGLTNWVVGDPQWIGMLQDPSRPHTNDNRFIARYAFMVLPAGRSLDLNWIHNHALGLDYGLDMRPGRDNGYYRNQGVGSWELNLAGFLADLNTNYWGFDYAYDPFNIKVPRAIAQGAAFNDAREILRYRYTPPYLTNVFFPPQSHHTYLDTFLDLFPGIGPGSSAALFANDQIDGFANTFVTENPLGTMPPSDDDLSDRPNRPWPGADSKRHYFSIRDLFDPDKLVEFAPETQGFRYKVNDASARGNSYDRYTLYRLLAQIGTDSASEEDGKINLNYVNIRSWAKDSSFRFSATNLVPWTRTDQPFIDLMGRPGPELFFLTVATNLLAHDTNFAQMVTNTGSTIYHIPLRIPILTNGSTLSTNGPIFGPLYSGRIHQILQLAANIYDATTGAKEGLSYHDTEQPEAYPYLPSVFRPQFEVSNRGEVFITNYVLVTETPSDIMTKPTWHDLDLNEGLGSVKPNDGIYGIPMIIGARKGYPNFNELGLMTSVEAIRRMEIRRAVDGAAPYVTNQMLIINMTNQVGFEALNSYATSYPRPIDLVFGIRTRSLVTNSVSSFVSSNWVTGYATSFLASGWTSNTFQFMPVPLQQPLLNYTNVSAPEPGGTTNLWGVSVTNRMLFFLVDRQYNRIVDAVSLNGPRSYFGVAGELGSVLPGKNANSVLGNVWSNARAPSQGTSRGVASQITISLVPSATTEEEWRDYNETVKSKGDEIQHFNDFLFNTKKAGTNQVPFSPVRRMIQTNYLRVNDPLVHYTLADLAASAPSPPTTLHPRDYLSGRLVFGTKNPESVSWGNGGTTADPPGHGSLNPRLRDPGVVSSDFWDFPTNHFPNIGWLGRIHRGTPWQTIFLKSEDPSDGEWRNHIGPSHDLASAKLMKPSTDWRLVDLFTTAPHPNATRGRLSINQTNLAAWSAVLAGVVVSRATNAQNGAFVVPDVVTPAALSDPVALVVAGINNTRAQRPSGQFRRLSDFLSVPELSIQSPFLNNAFFAGGSGNAPASLDQVFDSDYERIPQQILSLVKVGEPRFVIYAWGQSLKPARQNPERTGPSIVTTGPDRGLCRNYQITGEMATRAVVRVEFDTDPITGEPDYRRPHPIVESFNVLPIE